MTPPRFTVTACPAAGLIRTLAPARAFSTRQLTRSVTPMPLAPKFTSLFSNFSFAAPAGTKLAGLVSLSIVAPPVFREVSFCAAASLSPAQPIVPRVVAASAVTHTATRTALRVVIALYFAVASLPVMIIGSVLLWFVVWPLTRPFDPSARIAGYFFRHFFASAQAFNPFWSVKLVGPRPSKAPSKTVVVCNHLSNADAIVLGYLLPFEAKFVSKDEVKFLPFIGWGMWLVGDVFVGFRETHSSKDGWKATNRDVVLEKCKRYLDRNCPVMIFPEGWRSPTTDLLYFKDGAFEVAIATGADILPMALAGTDMAMPLGEALPDLASCYLTMGDYISTKGMTADDVPRLKQQTRDAIYELKKRIDPLVEDERRAARIRRGVSPDSTGIVPNAELLYGRAASKTQERREADAIKLQRQGAPSA